MAYVDGFVLPVPKRKLEAYRRMARLAGKIWREHGALDFKECVADDVKPGKWTSFPQSVKLKRDETVMFSWIDSSIAIPSTCGTSATSAHGIAGAGTRPATSDVPPSAGHSPPSRASSVDLPLPDRPRTTTSSPAATVNETGRNPAVADHILLSSRASIIGSSPPVARGPT